MGNKWTSCVDNYGWRSKRSIITFRIMKLSIFWQIGILCFRLDAIVYERCQQQNKELFLIFIVRDFCFYEHVQNPSLPRQCDILSAWSAIGISMSLWFNVRWFIMFRKLKSNERSSLNYCKERYCLQNQLTIILQSKLTNTKRTFEEMSSCSVQLRWQFYTYALKGIE